MSSRQLVPVVVAALLPLSNAFASPTLTFNSNTVRGSVTDTVSGTGTITLSNAALLTLGDGSMSPNKDYFWDGGTPAGGQKTYWSLTNGSIYVSQYAKLNNNEAKGTVAPGIILNADLFVVYGNIGGNDTIEFAPGFKADLGTGPGDIQGGLSTLRVNDAVLRTHASKNLPSVWKHTADHQPSGTYAVTHHGLLIFAVDDSVTPTPSTTTRWEVRTSSQMYDGGLNWGSDWTLDVADGLQLVSDTTYEQALGPHVSFGDVRNDNIGAIVTKTGSGKLLIARGGIQCYAPGAAIDIQQGEVEYSSNPAQTQPTYYSTSASGQNLAVSVASGAAVSFRSYTWPYPVNWWNPADTRVDNEHEILSLDSSGLVTVGGLSGYTPRGVDLNTPLAIPETAVANDAFLKVAGNATFASSGTLRVHLGAGDTAEPFKINVGGNASLAGTLQVERVGGYLPSHAEQFTLLTATSVGGVFTSNAWGLVETAPGEAFVVQYSPTSVILKEFTLRGDLDFSGEINNQDIAPFVALLTGGTPAGAIGFAGDIDGNGQVNNQDIAPFVALLTGGRPVDEWGADSELAPLLALVPEPTSLWLLSLTSFLAMRRRRRR